MLRLTQEADNALRIMLVLTRAGERLDAPTLAQCAGIAPQFTLKILRKLKSGGLLTATHGAHGGYLPSLPPEQITVLRVVELIDGPVYINRCLESGFVCSRMGRHTERCAVNRLFADINRSVCERLTQVTFADLLRSDASIAREADGCPLEPST